MTIQVAETSKAKRAPKALSHLEIHPKLGGGHVVKHVYTGYSHEPKEYQFNKDGIAKGGEHIADHLAKHAGLPGLESEADE
jgi:hypothetical protein